MRKMAAAVTREFEQDGLSAADSFFAIVVVPATHICDANENSPAGDLAVAADFCQDDYMKNAPPGLPLEIDVHAVKQLIDQGSDFVLLDCREEDEYAIARIEHAQLLPMSQIQQRLNELEPHRDRRIVVHCHFGGRSLRVTEWLRELGFARTQNMTGGIDAWSLEIDRSLPRYE